MAAEVKRVTVKPGRLRVITGPTAAGKDTVMNALLERYPQMQRVVTYTSRPLNPERGEVDGVDYHFVTEAEFKALVDGGKLVESVPYGEHFKGTLRQDLEVVLTGQDVIWRIDMSRAAGVAELFAQEFGPETAAALKAQTVVIAIVPDKVATLRQRWVEGKRGDKAEFNRRMRQDAAVWREKRDRFDQVIVNPDGAQTATIAAVMAIVEGVKNGVR